MKKDYYFILKLNPKASLKDIKSAYRQMALKFHPDINKDHRAVEKFADIREAYEVLSDSKLRHEYDLSYRPQPSQSPQAHEPDPVRKAKKAASPRAKGKNLRYNLYINLEDVSKGCERSIRYVRNNNGENETLQLKVKVPKGAYHNQRLKISRYGDVDGEAVGDLFVIVHLHEHPLFLRDDLNLRVNVPIQYIDAMLGATIEVPTIKGIRKLKLKAYEFEPHEYRMKAYGLPDAKNQFRGDLIIYCFVEHPRRLSSQEKNALQKMQKSWPKGEMMQEYQSYLSRIKGN